MSESIITELPSYESVAPDDDDEDPPPPLTPSTAHMAELTAMPLPLVPVRRATAPTSELQLAPDGVSEALATRSARLQVLASQDTMMQTTAGGGTSGSSRRTEPTSVQQLESSYFETLRPRPMKNVEFSFSPVGTNAMLLLPPPEEENTRPLYYISVSMNPFMPLSHITKIYRGGSERAPRVGEFEMGIIKGFPGELQIGDNPTEDLSTALTKAGFGGKGQWRWLRQGGAYLLWNCGNVPFVCILPSQDVGGREIVARYTPHLAPHRTPKNPPGRLPQLEVLPLGQAQSIFDEIIISLLVLERKRLTPNLSYNVKELFNFQ